jgi:PAS domain S-box-containing protein
MPAAVEPEVVARPPGPSRFLRTLRSLRTRLIALVLLALAPAAALIAWMNVDARRTRDDEVRASAQRLVHVCAAAYAGALDEAREFLRTLSDVPIVTAGSPRECSAFLADVLPRHPGFANVGVVGADGALRCSAVPYSGAVDLSGRPYFARALSARRFEIGEFQRGQVTARSALNVALPIADGDRPPRAVLYAALDLAWLGRLARDAEVPEGGTLTVADRGGTIVARNPNPEIVGQTVANVPLVRRVMAEREGTGETSGVDGVRRMYAFTTLLNHGEPYAYVAVGFPRDVAYAQADRMLWRSLLLFGLALAGALTLAWAGAEGLVLRRAKALIDASRRLQAGEYAARSGVGGNDELGRLAATFDEMAAALERREQDRQVWAAEISKLHASLEQRVRDRTAELEAANERVATRTAELQAANLELVENERFLDSVVENLPNMLFVKDAQNLRFVRFNRAGEELLGYSHGELIGRNDYDFFEKAEADFFTAKDREVLAGGAAVDIPDEPVHTRHRGVRLLHTKKIPILDERGAPRYLLGISEDITDRRAAERALGENRERLQAILDNSPALIYLKDLDGRYLLVNSRFEAVFRTTRAAALGRTAHDLFPPVLADAYRATDAKVLETGRMLEVEETAMADGATRVYSSIKFPLNGEHGRPVALCGISIDITEKKIAADEIKMARLEAEQANRAKTEFLSRMSHDLRTPLNAILGFAQLLESDVLPPAQRDCVEQIISAGDHLLGLINEVLDIARIETGELALSPEPVAVADLVARTVQLIAPLASRRGVQVRADGTTARGLYVLADRQRLSQIVLNLLSNAVKYNREAGQVIVSVRASAADRVRISVRDTGAGISAEKLSRLFRRFDRLGAEASGVEGTGLGLTVARELARAMGGELGVDSVVGEGSTFWVGLPLTEQQVVDVTVQETDVVDRRLERHDVRGRVLYVDDNRSNIRLLERVLERRPGVVLDSATLGRDGIERARAVPPDLVLLDLHLPDMDGADVLRELRLDERTGHVPVAILSADAASPRNDDLRDAGAIAYLTKPLQIAGVLKLVDETLSRGGRREP